VYPAVVGVAPALALVAMGVSWTSLSLPDVITSAAVGVLFVVFADLARRFGKRTEMDLFKATGGRPSLNLLWQSDPTFDAKTKERYRNYLAAELGEHPPAPETKAADPDANGFYQRCGNWLRERTRDKEKFRLLFEENITYGFRRNLLGIKWPGLILNLLVILIVAYLLYNKTSISGDGPRFGQHVSILLVAAVHAAYFLFFVTRKSVEEASNQYARQTSFVV
jgi:hypothetical protein